MNIFSGFGGDIYRHSGFADKIFAISVDDRRLDFRFVDDIFRDCRLPKYPYPSPFDKANFF